MAVVAGDWQRAFAGLGHEVVTVAGSGTADRLVPGLGWPAGTHPPRPGDVAAAIADVDLVVVENLLSLPLNPAATRVVAAVLAGRPALLHHYDLPWQRDRFRHHTGWPPDDPAWRHVTLNELSRRQLAERGIRARVVPVGVDPDEAPGDRAGTRGLLGMAPDERIVLHPARAIPRKRVPVALALAEQLGATYWLTGPAEEDYGGELQDVLGAARTRVVHRPAPTTMADAYAAADVVAFPSAWEGFGLPLLEAAVHRRPLAGGDFPVADELRARGFRWFSPADPDRLARFLERPDEGLHDHNAEIVRAHFSHAAVSPALAALLDDWDGLGG